LNGGSNSQLEAEALRINERFLTEVVEPFEFCPFARGARESGALVRRVLLDAPETAGSLAALDPLVDDPHVLVALLIYPRFSATVAAFERFATELRQAEDARRGGRSPLVTAVFHPRLGGGGHATPQQLVNLLRRSPDPMIQFTRFSALEAVRGAGPSGKFLFEWSPGGLAELERRLATLPVSERIARDNFATVERVGIACLEAILAELADDRARSYARLGEKSPPSP
jgi:hypothetical protein